MTWTWPLRKRADGGETACCPECDCEVDTQLTYCTACGYDIVRRAKIDLSHPPGVV